MGKLRDQLQSAQVARETYEAQYVERTERERRADRENSLTYLLTGLAAFYLAVRFGATKQLDAMGGYTSYIFEISLVLMTLVLLRPRLTLRALARPLVLAVFAASLVLGFAIQKIARLSGLAIPMDVRSHETAFLLLAVAPILEEMIFRFMLYKPFERVFNARTAWIVTSALFAYSHLHAIWFVPQEYDKFILYQTAYTFPLALVCGYMVRRRHSLLSAIGVHTAFNLGFFLAFWF